MVLKTAAAVLWMVDAGQLDKYRKLKGDFNETL